MPFTSLPDGDQLYYETHGSGPPWLVVTGLGGRAGFWHPHLEALTPHFTVILHDHRGCGQSSLTHMDYSVEQMAGDVAALLDHLEIESAAFIGHSTGGAIGQALALDHPGRVSRLMLASSWGGKDPYFEELFRSRKRMILELGPDEYVRTLSIIGYPADWLRDNPEISLTPKPEDVALAVPDVTCFAARMDAIRAFDRRAGLPGLDVPTLVACAEDDLVTPKHLSVELAHLIAGAELDLIPSGGHFYPMTRKETFRTQVIGFLSPR
ncbi:MAG: alpha/beta hydrolase [Pseudomonadota bacterium]